MHPMVNIGVKAARHAGDLIARAFARLDTVKVSEKGKNDFVTNVDQHCEQVIIDHILKAYPEHDIIGEESGQYQRRGSEFQWIIDPLDGTNNFIHGFPHFAVSIGIKFQGELEHGVIYDPIRDELFTATRGKGAQVNGKRMRVTQQSRLENSLLGTGFPYRNNDPKIDFFIQSFTELYRKVSGIRRAGSAALDLAYVAAGRFDGYWELGLSPWDMAAGATMIREAGGIITDFTGGNQFLERGDIISGNPKIYTALFAILQTLQKN
ncbi:MAG: inositol-1-monophosphatase [Legionellales bacterium]|nr:inositol-1-monophosphatase [Legionellales bacterium]